MFSTRKVMLSEIKGAQDLASKLQDMGELRLIQKKDDSGNDVVYLRERTNFEAFKEFFFRDEDALRQQKAEAVKAIGNLISRAAPPEKEGRALRQAIENIRTVVEKRQVFTGRAIAAQLMNYSEQSVVNPLADDGFVDFPLRSSINLLAVGPERVTAEHAVMRSASFNALPGSLDRADNELNSFELTGNSAQSRAFSLTSIPFGDTRVAARELILMPEPQTVKGAAQPSLDAAVVKNIFKSALSGKSGRVVVEPYADTPEGCSDSGLRAMLEAIYEEVNAAKKDENRQEHFWVAIAVKDESLRARISQIANGKTKFDAPAALPPTGNPGMHINGS